MYLSELCFQRFAYHSYRIASPPLSQPLPPCASSVTGKDTKKTIETSSAERQGGKSALQMSYGFTIIVALYC